MNATLLSGSFCIPLFLGCSFQLLPRNSSWNPPAFYLAFPLLMDIQVVSNQMHFLCTGWRVSLGYKCWNRTVGPQDTHVFHSTSLWQVNPLPPIKSIVWLLSFLFSSIPDVNRLFFSIWWVKMIPQCCFNLITGVIEHPSVCSLAIEISSPANCLFIFLLSSHLFFFNYWKSSLQTLVSNLLSFIYVTNTFLVFHFFVISLAIMKKDQLNCSFPLSLGERGIFFSTLPTQNLKNSSLGVFF